MTRALHVPALGRRGGGWVVLQVLLLAAIGACGFVSVYWPASVESFLVVLGLVAIALGAILFVVGAVALGPSLTPFPHPKARGRLHQGGIYRLVRHPVYGGLLLLALGWSLAAAPLGLVPTALLGLLVDFKARREEEWLVERYPEYAAYRARTPHRFVPWLP
jgi:protein-S-isoprenylcysteine O-methyltransferase Ste14